MLQASRRFYLSAIRGFWFRCIKRFFRFRQRKNRRARSLADCLVSRPVRETLALDTLHGKHRTFPIVDPESNTVRIAEIEFGKVAMQMLLFAMLVDAFHAALEDRIVAANRVRGDITPDVFLDAMVHRFMARKLFANRLVELRFIGHQRGFAGNVSAQDWHHLSNRSVVNVEAADRSAAPNNCRRMPCIASRSATPNASAMSCSPSSGSGWSMQNPCDKSFIRGAAAAVV